MKKKNIIKDNLSNFLYIFSDCIPVLGAKQSAICDLTRQEVYNFPSIYFDFFELFKKQNLEELYDIFENEDDKNNFEFFVLFLIENELAIFLGDLSLFPKIKVDWQSPNLINNSIIDIRNEMHDFKRIFNQLNNLNCSFIQLRFYSNSFPLAEIDTILKLAYNKSILSVDILLMYNRDYKVGEYVELFERHQIISSLMVHGSYFDKIVKINFGYNGNNKLISEVIEKEIVFTSQVVDSCNHCGIINKKYLSISSVQNFMENVICNGCMNEKISIDESGLIKNCPSMKIDFGNINSTNLKDVLEIFEFKQYWNITKDQIDVCKDCELRYLCTDCRAYTEIPDDQYSKPLKCGYNPYTNLWEEWSANPLKQKAIEYYGMQKLVKKMHA